MYYVFRDNIMDWHGKTVQAKATVDINLPEYGEHWWICKPMFKPLPHINFSVNSDLPLLDNFFTGRDFDLYSLRLIKAIKSTGVDFETFSASLIDEKTNRVIADEYAIFHLLLERKGLDKSKCEISGRQIKKLSLIDDIEKSQIPFFRLMEFRQLVLISQNFKEQLDSLGITGCCYVPLNEFQVGISL